MPREGSQVRGGGGTGLFDNAGMGLLVVLDRERTSRADTYEEDDDPLSDRLGKVIAGRCWATSIDDGRFVRRGGGRAGGTFETKEDGARKVIGDLCTWTSIIAVAERFCLKSSTDSCDANSLTPSKATLSFNVLDGSRSDIDGRMGVGLTMYVVCRLGVESIRESLVFLLL